MEESENTLFTLIFRKQSNRSLIFVLILKILISKIIGDFGSNQLEKFIEKEIISVPSSDKEIIRKNLFLKLNKYFQKLKYILHMLALGIFLGIDLRRIIGKIINLLIYLFYTYIKRKRPPIIPELPNIIKVVFKEKFEPKVIPSRISEKVPSVIDILDKMKTRRECKFFEQYVFNQKDLMQEMTKNQGVRESVYDRISAYCSTEVERAVKRFIGVMQRQPVTEGMNIVMREAKKISSNLDILEASLNNGKPRDIIDLKKFVLMSSDYKAVMKSLDSYQSLLKYETTPERLEFFRDHVLPDVFVVLYAIGKQNKK